MRYARDFQVFTFGLLACVCFSVAGINRQQMYVSVSATLPFDFRLLASYTYWDNDLRRWQKTDESFVFYEGESSPFELTVDNSPIKVKEITIRGEALDGPETWGPRTFRVAPYFGELKHLRIEIPGWSSGVGSFIWRHNVHGEYVRYEYLTTFNGYTHAQARAACSKLTFAHGLGCYVIGSKCYIRSTVNRLDSAEKVISTASFPDSSWLP